MREKFAGLCVGGPYAGKQIVEMSGVFKVEERTTPTKRLRPGGVVPSKLTFKTHSYRSRMVGKVGLWIHHSLTADEALQEIAAGYIEACRQADPRVTPSFSR